MIAFESCSLSNFQTYNIINYSAMWYITSLDLFILESLYLLIHFTHFTHPPSHAFVHAYLVMSESLQSHGLQSARLISPWNFPGKTTGVSCHFLL